MFLAKHAPDKGQRWVFGNFLFFRMHRIVDIYFVGGFGTVQWIDPADFTNCKPDAIVLDKPQRTLQLLNEHCSQARAWGWSAALRMCFAAAVSFCFLKQFCRFFPQWIASNRLSELNFPPA